MDDLIQAIAKKHATDPDLIRALLEWERARIHLKKRRNLIPDICGILERFSLEGKL